jgi:hypothetical protein
MPLPFAPPPEDSSLYQQLESTTLKTLTPDQLDTIRAKTFSQGTEGNEDEYRRLLLLGLAADKISLSGPIPKTCKIVTATTTQSSAIVELFTPAAGEVWEVGGFAINKTGLAGTLTWRLIADDGAQTATIDMSMVWGSSSQDPISATEDGFTPFYVDENMTLKFTVYLGGGFPTGEEAEGQVYLTRVR